MLLESQGKTTSLVIALAALILKIFNMECNKKH